MPIFTVWNKTLSASVRSSLGCNQSGKFCQILEWKNKKIFNQIFHVDGLYVFLQMKVVYASLQNIKSRKEIVLLLHIIYCNFNFVNLIYRQSTYIHTYVHTYIHTYVKGMYVCIFIDYIHTYIPFMYVCM